MRFNLLALALLLALVTACGSSADDKVQVDSHSTNDWVQQPDVETDLAVQDDTPLSDVAADSGTTDLEEPPQDELSTDTAVGDLANPDQVADDVALDTGEEEPCGDPAVMAKYGECKGAEDKETCEEAGGTWAIIGLAPVEQCQCPTGQGGCECTHLDDCIGACTADFQGGEMWNCEGLTHGYCSPYAITVGCWCFFWEEGQPEGICVD